MDLSSASHRLYRRALWVTALAPAPVVAMLFIPSLRSTALVSWVVGYAVFLGLLAVAWRRPEHRVAAAVAQIVLALACAGVQASSAEGAMLVTASALLATRWTAFRVVALSAGASVAFGLALAQTRPLAFAIDVPLAWFVFQVFAALVTTVARSEADARAALAERNVQLVAARQLLEERTRTAERLRVARDLHDGLGHHLSALSLNLEAAQHLSGDAALEHITRARRTARALLDDVRATVADTRTESADPMPVIRAMAGAIGEPRVHLDGPASLAGVRPAASADPAALMDAVVRVAQEIMTNTMRHAAARNLWLRVWNDNGDLCLEGRDDGRGLEAGGEGFGLAGMRERLAALGGHLDVANAPDGGAVVRARIPLARAAP